MRAPDLLRVAVRFLLAATLLLLAIPAGSSSALGHGGQPAKLMVNPQASRPGSMVEITGADFTPGARVSIGLSSGLGSRDLSVVSADAEGHFFDAVRLPADLPGGIWEVRVRDAQGTAAVTGLVIEVTTDGRGLAARPSDAASEPGPATLAPLLAAALVGCVALVVAMRLVRRATLGTS